MANVQTEAQIKGLGTIVYCNDASFNVGLDAVLRGSNGLISLRDLAYARIQAGKAMSVSQNGSFVREGSLFVPKTGNKRIWLRDSLMLLDPSDAVKAHRKCDEYLLPKSFNVDAYLEQIGKDNYLVLKDTSAVPTNRFGEHERMVWAFQDQAEKYGQFLKSVGIHHVKIWMYPDYDEHIDMQLGPFAYQLWLRGLKNNSRIDGGRSLDRNTWVRGVRRESAEGGAHPGGLEKAVMSGVGGTRK
ncbi:MAG: hypothetical protein V1702_04620 [Candidatus Woesearchaeota archaeon]